MEAVPRMPMLSFELKHSPEYVEFGPTLKNYIRDHYGEDPAHYNKSCNELEQLRQSAVHVSHDFMGCSTLKKYYSQLQFLQGRFPMLEGGEASIPFTWEEVFSGREMTLSDIKFEQACILYNIGALHSVLGAMDTRQSADGMKVSCTHFQCASWAFEYLRDHFGCAAMSLDMTHELLTFQLNLMLAQAQECILEKSMTDSRKSTITAKVAAQIVEFYRTSMKHLDVCNLQELISSKRYKDWKKKIDIKILFYTCITNFYMGRQSEDQQKHGQCLAYYTISLEKLTECEKLAKNEGVEIQDSLRFTHDVVGGKHQSAKKDNDFVYHDKVPPADSLPEVKGASLVKGIPFNPNDPEISGQDIFNKLVPMSAHEAASLYSEEKATLLRRMVSEIQEKNEELNQYLASLQLDHTSLNPEPERLPQQLLEKCAALSVRPTAIKELVDSMTAVSNVATEVDLGIKEIQQTLQEESTAELEFQDTFGKRNPNAILSEIAQECARLEEGHKKGSQSNTDLHKAMNTHINNLKLLSSPLEDLQKLLPSVDKDRDPESNDVIKQLNNLLSKIEEMKTQRQTLEEQLRKEVLEDDITGVLCKQESINREVLFSEQLKKHDKTSGLIRQNLTAQNNILRALTDANAKYATVRKATSEALSRREQTIRDLINSYDVYEDLKAKSQKGLEFYKKLETNVGRLLNRCKNVCKVQQDERQKMYNKYKPKAAAPAPVRPVAPKVAPADTQDNGQITDTPAVSHPPAHTMAAMFDGPKLKDYLPFMKPKTFGKKGGSPPVSAAHPNVQDYMTQGGSLPNSGTASPVHIPQMPGSVPASPDHVRHRFDGRLGPNDPSTSRMLPRQPGPDLTQGHLYQPSSSSGEGQSAREMGLGPTALDSSLYGPESLYQQQLDQGQMGYIQGQGVKPGGPDTAQAPPPQSDYVPLDQRWKKDKPVTPQSAYPQPGQRPVVSRSLKPQTSQGIPPNTPQQPNQTPDQQNFYAQNLALANQELLYGQPGTFQGQGQNIPNQSMPAGQGQMQTSQYGQNMADFQTQRFPQPPQLPVHSAPASQVISQMPSSLPPQSMPVTREVTSTVSAVGGPVLSPGNENQDYRSMPQSNFGPRGQGQGQINIQQVQGQEHMSQPGYSEGQQVLQQFPQSQPQQHRVQPPGSQSFQGQGQVQVSGSQAQFQHSTFQPSGSQHQRYDQQHVPVPQQTGQQQHMGQGQTAQPAPQQHLKGQGQVTQYVSQQQGQGQTLQQIPQHMTQQVGQYSQAQPQYSQAQPQYSQAQPQSSQVQPQYSQAQPQYSQLPANAQYNQGVQPAGQVNLQPTNQGQFDQRGTVQGQTSQFIPGQQLPGQQQLAYQPSVQGQTGQQKPFVHQAGQQIQTLPRTQQQTYTPAQQQNVPLQPSKFHAQQQFHQPPQSAPVQTAYSGASIQAGPQAPAQQQGVSTAGGQQNLHQFQPPQQNFSQTQFSSSASSGTAGGYMQSGPRFAAPTSSMPQQQGVPAAPVTGQVAPVQQPVVGQGQQYQQPMIPQGQNFVQPPHSSPAHPVYGAGALQSGQRFSAPTSASSQQNVQGQQYTGHYRDGIPQSQQGGMQPPLSGQGHQGQSAKTYSPAPAAPVSQPSNVPTIPPVSGQGQFVQGHGTQQNVQGQYIGPQSQIPMGQGQFIPGQGMGQQPQRPQVSGYSETVVNRQFTQGQIPHGQSSQELPSQSQPKGQIPPSQGSQVYSRSQLPSSQSQQTYPQSQVGQFNQYQGQVPVNQQRPGVPNQTVAQQQYGHQGQMQGQSQYGQGTSQLNQTGSLPPMQQIPQQGQMSNKQSVLQPEVLKPTLPSGLGQGQTSSPQNQQNLYSSQGQGQNIQPPLQQQPVQPQGQPVTPIYQPVSPMHGNYQQGQQRPPSPAVPIVTQQGHIKTQDVKPTSSVEVKPSQPQRQKSHQSAARNISVDRQLSTASSLDEILSSSPDARTESAESVLAPKVLTAQEIQQQKEDQLKNSSLHIQPKDPYKDKSKLDRFVAEVEKLAKFVEGFEKPLCSGPTPLDVVWKEIMEEQDKAGRKQKLAIARCYPMKNRDQDIMPYDDSRVLLTTLNDDYINASWINDLSPSCPKFIASQAPLPVTLIDFWLMVYEQGVEVLVALSSEIETGKKFPTYLPQGKGETVDHGAVQLTLQSIKHKQFWTERILHLRHAETRTGRTLVHLHYNAWPVSGFPEKVSHVLQFITEVHSFYRQQRSLMKPIVVHCGNGVGRTGMFILIYVGMQEINHGDGIINIQEVAGKMLWRRRNIILKQDQLKYCYEAILYYAQDVLAKEGILVHKASFGDGLPKPGAKSIGWEPGQDILFGSVSFTNLQSSISKMSTGTKTESNSLNIDQKLEMLKKGETSVLKEEVTHKVTKQEIVVPEGHVLSSVSGNSLPDVVQNPGINLERKSAESLIESAQDDMNVLVDIEKSEEKVKVQGQTEDLFSDLCLLKLEEKGSVSSLKSLDSAESKGSRSSSVHASPAHSSREVSSSPKPENISSSLAELQDPTKFTIGTSEGSKKKVTKADFTGDVKTVMEQDPNDPFSSLDPLWTHK
ncbi:tyrosine-protein phosphatase non-receptor type 23-like [Mercenaria mercenaria]|uniref:tyrosine-protein phosphatase non-receptor type 23-like n=1 Tax=Mercenaria mercenaria TaxID=6596 RepID=UPI00234EB7A3|nr:tyrosine-protein phosphatase non-receptor type 23-like [Mercenaria mercenaria]